MKITGVILAAGKSTRMGADNKLLLKYKNHTIIEEVIKQMTQSDIDNIFIITGHEKDRLSKLLHPLFSDRLKIIYNKNYELGRSESIKCAVNNIFEDSDAICFMVGDKPQVTASLYNKCLDEFKIKKPDLLYVETPSGRGHPVIFSDELFPELLKLQGDTVGNDLIERLKKDAIIIKEIEPQIDIDTKKEYQKLITANINL